MPHAERDPRSDALFEIETPTIPRQRSGHVRDYESDRDHDEIPKGVTKHGPEQVEINRRGAEMTRRALLEALKRSKKA